MTWLLPSRTVQRQIRWWLKWSTLKERLWEPIRKRLFLARQLRTERDYWKAEAKKLESQFYPPALSPEESRRMYPHLFHHSPIDPKILAEFEGLKGAEERAKEST